MFWQNITPKYLENKVRELNYKIVHNIVPTRVFLQKINCLRYNTCEWCPNEETIVHLFFECEKVKPLWSEVEKAYNSVYDQNIKLNRKNVLRNDFENVTNDHLKDIIILISYAKHAIWHIRQKSIHGDLIENVSLKMTKNFQQKIQRYIEKTGLAN